MNSIKRIALVGLLLFGHQSFAQFDTSWDNSERSINQISEHVYRWGGGAMGGISGLYVPTSEGIIVIDGPGTPCTPDSGQWFKDELEQRYDVPVRYVVLSHDHQSHICGLTVFSDTAVAIGHKKIRPHLIREGRIAPVPTVTFEDSLDIDLGGVKVVLHYFGPTHSDNLIVIHIPEDGVLFAPDLARPAGQLPNPDFRDMDVDSTIEVLGILARMDDVDIVVPGHNSPLSTQDYFARYREYMIALRERVLTHMVDDRSLVEILELVDMSDFSEYTNLEQYHEPNVTSMYDYLYRYREPNSPGGMPIRAPQ
jgi:glyoxylase-like metal-dependent hydrolase (beta-lactamase superfamily II)